MRKLIIFLFYVPLVFKTLNLQAFLSKFTPAPESIIQLFAYFTLLSAIAGAIILIRRKYKFPFAINIWIYFFIIYFTFAIVANIYHGTEPHRFLVSVIAPLFFLSFSVLLSIPEERRGVAKVLAISFLISCILNIIFNFYNLSMDYEGIYKYELNRAGGIYGDANNTAVASLLSFVFIEYIFKPISLKGKILKTLALLISTYSVVITYSKTGFVVLAIILIFTYRKFLNPKRLLVTILVLPLLLFFGYSYLISSDSLNPEQKNRVESFVDIITLQTDNLDLSGRDYLLKNMYGFVEKNPILGNGVSFGESIRGHNTIIGVWADAGVMVFLMFCFLLIYYLIKAVSAAEKPRFFSLSVLLILIIYMLTLQTIINQAYLLVVFALVGYVIQNESSQIFPKNQINEN